MHCLYSGFFSAHGVHNATSAHAQTLCRLIHQAFELHRLDATANLRIEKTGRCSKSKLCLGFTSRPGLAEFLGRRPYRSRLRLACAIWVGTHMWYPGFVSRPGLAAFWVGAHIAHSFAEERARFLGRRPNVLPRICISPWAGVFLLSVLFRGC